MEINLTFFIFVIEGTMFLYFYQTENRNPHSTAKVWTFLLSEDILAGLYFSKDYLRVKLWFLMLGLELGLGLGG